MSNTVSPEEEITAAKASKRKPKKTGNSLSFLYLNSNHCARSTLNVLAHAAENDVDIVFLTEPYYTKNTNKLYE